MQAAPKTAKGIDLSLLRKADFAFAGHFTLEVTDHPELVILEEVVRVMPGKRIVAFGRWQGKSIVAKIFFGRHAKAHMLRELKGSTALTQAKIPTPKVHYHGPAVRRGVYVLIFERIPHSVNLQTFWEETKYSPEAEALLQALTIEIATQHVMGLWQEDLHLNNFLATPEQIYTLDGATIHSHQGPLPKKDSLENLALFFSQLGIQTAKLQHRLLQTYIKSRSWLIKKSELRFLQTQLRHWNVSRWQSYAKKIFRASTQFAKIDNLSNFTVYERQYGSEAFDAFLKNPDLFIDAPSTEILKAGRSATVAKVEVGDQVLVVKRYNHKGLWSTCKKWFKTSRARASWRLAHQLRFVGIATAKPVALIENRFLGLRGKTYFVMEYVEGQRADAFFADPKIAAFYPNAAKQIINLFFNLARLRLSHGDLKITNIVLHETKGPVILDLDSMREHYSSLNLVYRFKKDMQRLLENWQDQPSMYELFHKLIDEMSLNQKHEPEFPV